jgi:hypothetical protein
VEKHDISPNDLEHLAETMARAIPALECPECCECGWKFEYLEMSAALYREHWEWACLANALLQYRARRLSAQIDSAP